MKLIQDMTHKVFNILEKEEVDKMMNIGLKQDKCDDSISVDEVLNS